ncbi:hypothetical protein TL16_g04939 [Triparma laevis f. inornata]|uniref:Cytidyltransferase-like domain-containing protein n=1 Tax=Triparma laevis f. inornata TaxID=1714386 RepID=A0A9W7EA35_9STRA|nr:hypothetical protein TL16_g04939 [Triparma laevis f. inornata]
MMMIKPARKKGTVTVKKAHAKQLPTTEPTPDPPQPTPAAPTAGTTAVILSPRSSEMEQLKAKVATLEAQLSRQQSQDSVNSQTNSQTHAASNNIENIKPILIHKPIPLLHLYPLLPPLSLYLSSSSRRPSKSSTSSSLPPSRGGILGGVDFARVGEVIVQTSTEGTSSMINTLISGTSGAVVDVGRVLPAGHKKNVEEYEQNLENEEEGMMAANISQGACLDKFGYAPGEIVNKLYLEHAITEHEDRLIRYLLARDDRRTLENLMMIETGGITKENILRFREHLAKHLTNFRDSPMAKAGVGNGLFFDEGGENSDGGPGSPHRAPERPDTAMPKDDESLTGENPQPMIPFSSVIHKVLVKIAMRLRELGPTTDNREKVILVGSGMYNPLHRLHLRMFYLARQFLEGHSRFEVLGGIVSPCHPTAVRQKFRQKPREIIPPKHRLAMARLSVGDSAWLTVDPWEITRRRVLDYLSVLDHVREIIDEAFPHLNIRLIYMTDGNNLPKLSVPALKERKCNCLCICRPMQVDILLKQITNEWKNVAYVLEDTAILSNDLEGINSSRVRSDAIAGKDISKQTNKKVANYIKKHKIAEKMGGSERWNREDKLWDFKGGDELDRPYVHLPDSMMAERMRAESEDKLREEMGAVVHKEEFSLLF